MDQSKSYNIRMAVAFILSFILLMGSLYLMPKKTIPPAESGTNTVAAQTNIVTNVIGKVQPAVVLQTNLAPTNVKLSYGNELYLTVNSLGGRVTDLSINGKWNRKDIPVSLVQTNGRYLPGDSTLGKLEDLKNSDRPVFTVTEATSNRAVFKTVVNYQSNPVEIDKTFTVSSNYQFVETIEIKNVSKNPVRIDQNGTAYSVGANFAFFTKESANSGNLLMAQYYDGKNMKKALSPGLLSMFSARKQEEVISNSVWLAIHDYYFMAIVKPDISGLIGKYQIVYEEKGYSEMALGFEIPSLQLLPGESKTYQFNYYTGPKKEDLIVKGDKFYKKLFEWPMPFDLFMKPIEIAMIWIMGFFAKGIPNWGVVIILLALFIKLILSPLSIKAAISIKRSAILQPKLKNIQEKYKGDSKTMNEKVAELYKKEGVNPLGGCFPMLLQIPVFFALYRVLSSSVELRGAPFLWVKDLTQPDTLAKISLPFMQTPFTFNLLPLIMTAIQLVQMKLTSMKTPAAGQQQAMNTFFLPVIFLFMFYGMPSGLVLYWTIQNVYSIIEQYIVNLDTQIKLKK